MPLGRWVSGSRRAQHGRAEGDCSAVRPPEPRGTWGHQCAALLPGESRHMPPRRRGERAAGDSHDGVLPTGHPHPECLSPWPPFTHSRAPCGSRGSGKEQAGSAPPSWRWHPVAGKDGRAPRFIRGSSATQRLRRQETRSPGPGWGGPHGGLERREERTPRRKPQGAQPPAPLGSGERPVWGGEQGAGGRVDPWAGLGQAAGQ